MVVPLLTPHSSNDKNSPPSITSSLPKSFPSVFVFIFTFDTEAIDGRASPLNPKVLMENISSDVFILLVAWGRKAFFTSSGWIPSPSSIILIRVVPPSSISIVMFFEFASILFSTNSFTTEEGLSTTSPAAILFDVFWSKRFILFKYNHLLI